MESILELKIKIDLGLFDSKNLEIELDNDETYFFNKKTEELMFKGNGYGYEDMITLYELLFPGAEVNIV